MGVIQSLEVMLSLRRRTIGDSEAIS